MRANFHLQTSRVVQSTHRKKILFGVKVTSFVGILQITSPVFKDNYYSSVDCM